MTWVYVLIVVLLFVTLASFDAKRTMRRAAQEVLPGFEPRVRLAMIPILGTAWIVVHLRLFRFFMGRPEHMMVGFLGVQIAALDMPLKDKQLAIDQLRKNLGAEDLTVNISCAMRNIGIIGDSQSEGLAPHLVPLLRARGDRVNDTMLVRGMSIQSLRNDASKVRAAREVADNADTLIVILGGNNRLTGAAYFDEMKWFLENIARAPQTIWWVGPAHTVPRSEGHDRHLESRRLQGNYLPGQPRVKWIDSWGMTESGVQHAPDGLHFTRAGYAVWAQRLLPELADTSWGTWIGAGLLGAAVGFFLAVRRR